MKKIALYILPIQAILLCFACHSVPEKQLTSVDKPIEAKHPNPRFFNDVTKQKDLSTLADTVFVRLADYSKDFVYDMRYATPNNFLKQTVYDCAECYTRTKTAVSLIAANKEFMTLGYRIKFFDCYRPLDVQKRMWKIVSDPRYVANPAKGSIHNRGGAVDITLVDSSGKELPMGTEFDHFGIEAHHNYNKLPDTILKNRKLLKRVMEKHGFKGMTTEWWHYNLTALQKAKVANFVWDCD